MTSPSFRARYRARCRCGAVTYEVRADPVDAKICHCRDCQVLHGAPMQWAAIFHKHNVRFTGGLQSLRFYNGAFDRQERILPCKVAPDYVPSSSGRIWTAEKASWDRRRLRNRLESDTEHRTGRRISDERRQGSSNMSLVRNQDLG